MTEKFNPSTQIDKPTVYDEFPDGIGENPAGEVPGVRSLQVVGLKSEKDFKRAVKKGPVRDLVHDLHDQEKHVGLRWTTGKVDLFVANHRRVLTIGAAVAGTAIGLGLIGGGALYLTRRSSQRNK